MNIFNTSRSCSGIAIASVLALGVSFAGAMVASAQETTNGTIMPAIYNAAGVEVNVGTTAPLAPGYYYLAPGAQSDTEIYYNGDGTFVNETTGLYAGSVSDPDGTVGATLVYGSRERTVLAGAPNTGEGGNAMNVWMTLVLTSLIAVTGIAYLVTRRPAVTAL